MGELENGAFVQYVDNDGKLHPAFITGILRTERGEYLEKNTCHLTVFEVGRENHVTADYGRNHGQWFFPGEKTAKEIETTDQDHNQERGPIE